MLYLASDNTKMPTLKEQLYALCSKYISTREAQINLAVADAREAGANETKSSAGDKYETGREMMQQEIDLNLARLGELNKLKAILEQISPTQEAVVVLAGSLVLTSSGNYYIAIGAGQLKVDGVSYYAISAASPIGARMLGQRAGHAFEWNGKKVVITKVL